MGRFKHWLREPERDCRPVGVYAFQYPETARGGVSMFEGKATRDRKKIFEALFHSKPIVPKYETVHLPQHLTDKERLFFKDFEEFAAVVNWWFSDDHVKSPWRLQELTGKSLLLSLPEEPCYGRSFAVFHNQVQLGTLELRGGFKYSPQERQVWTTLQLGSARLLPFEHLEGFFVAIAEHLSNRRSDEYPAITRQMDRALIRVLWQTQHISEQGFDETDLGEIELHFQGTPVWYFGRRDCEAFRQLKKVGL